MELAPWCRFWGYNSKQERAPANLLCPKFSPGPLHHRAPLSYNVKVNSHSSSVFLTLYPLLHGRFWTERRKVCLGLNWLLQMGTESPANFSACVLHQGYLQESLSNQLGGRGGGGVLIQRGIEFNINILCLPSHPQPPKLPDTEGESLVSDCL